MRKYVPISLMGLAFNNQVNKWLYYEKIFRDINYNYRTATYSFRLIRRSCEKEKIT